MNYLGVIFTLLTVENFYIFARNTNYYFSISIFAVYLFCLLLPKLSKNPKVENTKIAKRIYLNKLLI